MVRHSLVAIATLASSLALVSCATIFAGSTDLVTFNSTPPGAEVLVNGTSVGVTPLTAAIDKEAVPNVVIRKQGFADQPVYMSQSTEPWFWGNIILGGLIGSSVDFSTGAVNRYEPDAYYVTLAPISAGADFYETDPEFAVRSVALSLHDQIGSELANHAPGEAVEAMLTISPGLTLDRLRAIYFDDASASTLAFSDRIVDAWKVARGS